MNVTLKNIEVRYDYGIDTDDEGFDYVNVNIENQKEILGKLIDDALGEHEWEGTMRCDYDVKGKHFAVDFDTDCKWFNVYSEELGLDYEGRAYPDLDKPLSEVIKDHTGYIEKVMSGEWKND